MIDKLDMNLFGRFLPPYMLESKSNNSNFTQQMMADPSVGLAGGGLGVGLGNASVDSGIGIGVGTGGAFGANGGDTLLERQSVTMVLVLVAVEWMQMIIIM